MAQNTTTQIPAKTWTQLTNADVTSITVQNVGGGHILIKGTTSASAPTSPLGSNRLNPGQGIMNEALANLWPGISGVVRVYCWADSTAEVMVSHA